MIQSRLETLVRMTHWPNELTVLYLPIAITNYPESIYVLSACVLNVSSVTIVFVHLYAKLFMKVLSVLENKWCLCKWHLYLWLIQKKWHLNLCPISARNKKFGKGRGTVFGEVDIFGERLDLVVCEVLLSLNYVKPNNTPWILTTSTREILSVQKNGMVWSTRVKSSNSWAK